MVTQSNLRASLATIFGVDQRFIIPKQGNWWNPQTMDLTVGTWIAFLKRDGQPRVKPWFFGSISTTYKISNIDMQIVGSNSEYLADSIAHWLLRDDVQAVFENLNAALLLDGLGKYTVSQFNQDGGNSVLAYNVSFRLQWASEIQTFQTIADEVTLSGEVIT